MGDPLKPNPALLCKLGSVIVHADEFLSPGGHHLDETAFRMALADPDVQGWLAQMRAMAMVPLKRTERKP